MTAEYLTSDLLRDVTHGFFTRNGGASDGIFASLNCGYGSDEQEEIVTVNRKLVARAMGLPLSRVASVVQVHSADVRVVTEDNLADRPVADAQVTATPGIGLAVLTADCLPVLLADTEAGVIGAAHAGWKGALAGVLEATVEAMCGLGAEPARIRAAIGPAISQRAYEVGEEFLERFLGTDPDHARYFANGRPGHYQFDLPRFGLDRLRAAGVAQVEWTGHCTCSDPARFYSYRRSVKQGEASYGRLMSVIRL